MSIHYTEYAISDYKIIPIENRYQFIKNTVTIVVANILKNILLSLEWNVGVHGLIRIVDSSITRPWDNNEW